MKLTGQQTENVDWFLGSYWVEQFERLSDDTPVAKLIPSVAARFKHIFFGQAGEPLTIPAVVENIVRHSRMTR